ncbi:MAG: 2-oxoglutarate dehydrogenase complex dihydrolipoyllysine-residue succinyltransferase [Thermodesulfobacteriota bacterium]
MKVDVKVPEVGESVQEAILAEWYKADGEAVEKEEPVFVLETDKVTLEVPAEESGTLEILVQAGETVEIGKVVGRIDTEAGGAQKKTEEKAPAAEAAEEKPAAEQQAAEKDVPEKEAAPEKQAPAAEKPKAAEPTRARKAKPGPETGEAPAMPPSVRRLASEKGVDVSRIQGSGPAGQVTKGDVIDYLESGGAKGEQPAAEVAGATAAGAKAAAEPEAAPAPEPPKAPAGAEAEESVTRQRMSPIRKRIAAHLLDAKQNTAMLTTFNEIDMSRVKSLRDSYKDPFNKAYGVRLGFMSFFVKAVVAALKEFPEINARIDGDEIVYHHYYHIGIAIGAPKGLVVPVIRHADRLGFADIESAIVDFSQRVQQNKIALSELEGGTFSITNGGIYGSLLSTPILNMPQSAILGMHKIEDRPVAVDGQVVIRPMMYVALSYDHRIVDGKDAVSCLRRIKEFIETPERMMMEI